VQDRVWCELVKLHTINKKKPTKEFVGRKGKTVMTHKYRGSQQSSREVKPKFIDLTQGEPKNICKP
jgi:hypothetical protein